MQTLFSLFLFPLNILLILLIKYGMKVNNNNNKVTRPLHLTERERCIHHMAWLCVGVAIRRRWELLGKNWDLNGKMSLSS